MTSKLTITDERLAELVAFKPLPGTDITSATRDEWMAMAAELQERRKAEKNCEPVAYMTYKGYLLHAGDPKLAEFSEPTPLYADPRPAAMPAAPVAWLWSRDGDDERDVSLTPPDDDADAADAIECGWTASPLYRHAQPAPDREQVRREHAEWSQGTFGNVGPVGPLKHLSKEALEAAEQPGDLSEWADMQFLLWDAQRRAGITDDQITQAMIEKLAVNKQREWPEPKDGEPRLHIKDQPSAVGPVTDAMAYAFHHALTDGPLGDDDVEDIKIGLRAAFANVTTYQPLPVVLKEHQIRELVNKLRDIAIEYHGTQQLREHIACVIRTAMSAVAPPAPKSAVI